LGSVKEKPRSGNIKKAPKDDGNIRTLEISKDVEKTRRMTWELNKCQTLLKNQ
jgi:hypothetical protein